jgi:hypothetical protein
MYEEFLEFALPIIQQEIEKLSNENKEKKEQQQK